MVGPVGLGALLGCLYTMAPDHLATLVSMTAGLKSADQAFFVGLYWGLGHCIGMSLVFLILLTFRNVVSIDNWEHYGNYLAGVVLVVVGLYFLRSESDFIEETEGGYVVKSCACCYTPLTTPRYSLADGDCDGDAEAVPGAEADAFLCLPTDTSPNYGALKTQPRGPHQQLHGRQLQGVLFGIIQGLCCPSCLLGVGIAGKMAVTGSNMAHTVLFMAVFVCVTVVLDGLVAVGWMKLSTSCNLNALHLYRGSCIATILLGLVWIFATSSGFISRLEYTDSVAADWVKSKDHDLMSGAHR